jgi:transposase
VPSVDMRLSPRYKPRCQAITPSRCLGAPTALARRRAVDQGHTGVAAAVAAAAAGIHSDVVRLPAANRGFALLPRRWVVKRSFGGLARFRRLALDYERLADTIEGLTFVVFVCLMLHQLVHEFSS